MKTWADKKKKKQFGDRLRGLLDRVGWKLVVAWLAYLVLFWWVQATVTLWSWLWLRSLPGVRACGCWSVRPGRRAEQQQQRGVLLPGPLRVLQAHPEHIQGDAALRPIRDPASAGRRDGQGDQESVSNAVAAGAANARRPGWVIPPAAEQQCWPGWGTAAGLAGPGVAAGWQAAVAAGSSRGRHAPACALHGVAGGRARAGVSHCSCYCMRRKESSMRRHVLPESSPLNTSPQPHTHPPTSSSPAVPSR